ncbi:MAG: TraR/DksA family transcriptional regulator [Desulfotignum sp.]
MNSLLPSSTDMNHIFIPCLDNEKLSLFKEKLLAKQQELVRKRTDIKKNIRSLKMKHADVVDQSILMSNIEKEIDFSRRCDVLITQIERALERIEDGGFGYCELTGEPIDERRLEVLPWATLSIKALEEIEKKQSLPYF